MEASLTTMDNRGGAEMSGSMLMSPMEANRAASTPPYSLEITE